MMNERYGAGRKPNCLGQLGQNLNVPCVYIGVLSFSDKERICLEILLVISEASRSSEQPSDTQTHSTLHSECYCHKRKLLHSAII